ncbi:hypothetical protein T484DRAFT_3267961 [Baffinella frigidus]|nr:hypothetical protein T484DRAFT_3267961 [Cryptophyta sp. CCMP2293]
MGAIWLLLLSLASGRDGLIGAAGTHLPARSSCLAFAPSLAGAGSRPLLRCGTLLAASARSVPAWEGAAVQRLLVKGVRDNFSPQRPSTASAVRPEPVPVSALIMSVFKNPAASLYDEPWVSFKGVSRTPSGKFAAGIWIGGEAKHLGTYEHQQDAARVYDSAVMEHRPRWCDEDLNFPAASREERENAHLRRFQRVSSFKGVSRAPSGKWQVQISVGGTTQYRGYYQDERDAVLAYDRAVSCCAVRSSRTARTGQTRTSTSPTHLRRSVPQPSLGASSGRDTRQRSKVVSRHANSDATYK